MKKQLIVILAACAILVADLFLAACGDKDSVDHSTPAHTHTWGSWSVTTAATCTIAGVETRVCSLDASHTDTRPLAALGHDYQWKVTALATFDDDGEEQEICTHNSTHTRGTRSILSVQSAINALEGGSSPDAPASLAIEIDLSDMAEADSDWAKFLAALDETGKYFSLDLSNCEMDGAKFDPVFSITDGKDKIVSLILPDTAESIAAGTNYDLTFKNFTALISVSGAGVETVGDYAFQSCTALESVSLPMATSIGISAFQSCTALESVSLPMATSIDDYAFQRCTALESISLPLATSIGNYAFDGCTALESVSLLLATSIGISAFGSCTALESISLPMATSIDDYAFYGCTALGSVGLGASAPTLNESILSYAYTSTTRTITIKVPSGATGYDEAWKTKLLENSNNITLAVVEQ